ncbi:unnamed protein product [Caretta caretta]
MKDTIFAKLNTRGCNVGLCRCQVLSFLWGGGGVYAVIFLQETHTAPAVEASWQLELGDEVYFCHLSARSAGVATLFSPERFYRQASAFLGTLDPHECLVLGGDFNATLEDRDCSGVETSCGRPQGDRGPSFPGGRMV